jgi:uncharacterized OB-fold protein
MWDPSVGSVPARRRVLNAVALQNAVLCADCDVVSDSPHDTCLACGSRSLFNIARVFGGKLPKERASVVAQESVEIAKREVVLAFPKVHRARRRATDDSRQSIAFSNKEIDEVDGAVLLGPQGR